MQVNKVDQEINSIYSINSPLNGHFMENTNLLKNGIKPIFKVFYGLF